MEPDFKTQGHSLNFSLKDPSVLQQLLTSWGEGGAELGPPPPPQSLSQGLRQRTL